MHTQQGSIIWTSIGSQIYFRLQVKTYIQSIAKEAGKMVSSFSHSRKFLAPFAMLYLYKCQIRFIQFYGRDDIFSTLQPLSHRHIMSLLQLYYDYMANVQTSPFFSPLQWGHNLLFQSQVILISGVLRKKFHSDIFFSKKAILWNILAHGCFPVHYTLNLFKSRVNHYPPNFHSLPPTLTFITYTSFNNCLPWVVLKPCVK